MKKDIRRKEMENKECRIRKKELGRFFSKKQKEDKNLLKELMDKRR